MKDNDPFDNLERLLEEIELAPWVGHLSRRIDADERPVRQCLANQNGRVLLRLAPDAHHSFADALAAMHNSRAELVRLARIGLSFERAAARFGDTCLACGSWDNGSLVVTYRGDMAARQITCHACGAEYNEIWNHADEYSAAFDSDGA